MIELIVLVTLFGLIGLLFINMMFGGPKHPYDEDPW